MLKACDAIREKLFRAASTAKEGTVGGGPLSEFKLADGKVVAADIGERPRALLSRGLMTGKRSVLLSLEPIMRPRLYNIAHRIPGGGAGNNAEGLWKPAIPHTGLHSRRYSARLSTHAVVSAPPKGRRRRACAITTHRKEPHFRAAFG